MQPNVSQSCNRVVIKFNDAGLHSIIHLEPYEAEVMANQLDKMAASAKKYRDNDAAIAEAELKLAKLTKHIQTLKAGNVV